MTNPDELPITSEVLARFEGTPDPRLRELVSSLTLHMHAFVRDTRPTFDEWLSAIKFLTHVGHTCDDKRQEFILLSDVMGISMLVDSLNHDASGGATETTVLGPFFVEGAPQFEQGADITNGAAGERLFVDVRIADTAGVPLPGAVVDVWQSDTDGFYDVQLADRAHEHALRGTLTADAAGRVRFWTIMPTAYPLPVDGPVGELLRATERHPWRPAHLHFKIAMPGYKTLVTHIFVEGDRYLETDVVFGVKGSLIAPFPAHAAGDAPDGKRLDGPWRSLGYDFRIEASGA